MVSLESTRYFIKIFISIFLLIACILASLLIKAIKKHSLHDHKTVSRRIDGSSVLVKKDEKVDRMVAVTGVQKRLNKINAQLSPLSMSIYASLYLAAIPFSLFLTTVYATNPISIPASTRHADSVCLLLGLYSTFLQSLLFLGSAAQSLDFYLRLCMVATRDSFILSRPKVVLGLVWLAALISSPWYLYLVAKQDGAADSTMLIVPQSSGLLCSLDWTSKSVEGIVLIAVNVGIVFVSLMCMLYCYLRLLLSSFPLQTDTKESDEISASSKLDSWSLSQFPNTCPVQIKLGSAWVKRISYFVSIFFLCWIVYFCKVCSVIYGQFTF
jgi:hypothetical protein